MKKAKLMLLSLVVVASVGAALAFKAKKYTRLYCIGTTVNNPNKFCPFTFVYKTFHFGPMWYYTYEKTDGTPVVLASDCPANCTVSSTLTLQ